MNVVINGVGVAGPTLAYWLTKAGHNVLLVEQAPQLRRTGYVVDFWGIGYDIAEKMGVLGDIQDRGYHVREVRFVNERGSKTGGFSVDVLYGLTDGRLTTLRRSDVSASIYRALDGGVETIFGDSVAEISEEADGVRVRFDHAPPRWADLVIGADGLHSRVRRLAFGTAAASEVSLDYHVAAFEVSGYQFRDELVYISHNLPGRQISRFSLRDDKTLFGFILRNEYMKGYDPKAIIRNAFADAGWEWPQIVPHLDRAPDLYFDSVSQVRLKHWTTARTALVGDAAACVSLMGGEGTGLAIAEAYVLAGELLAANGDIPTAFRRYEQRLMPLVKLKQAAAAKFASSFAPKTRFGMAFRNTVTSLMRLPGIAKFVVGRDLRDTMALPDYKWPRA